MTSLLWLIPLSMCLVLGACAVFLWAVEADQFEDLEREAQRVLVDPDGMVEE